jgi:hypothetical protein
LSERPLKRPRSDVGGDLDTLNGHRRLTEQDLRRQRKNERRRLARARAREERMNAVDSASSSRARANMVNEVDKEEFQSDEDGVTLQSVIYSWEDGGFTLLDGSIQSRRCSSLFEMKRTPDVLAKRFWMRLSQSNCLGEREEVSPLPSESPCSSESSFSEQSEDSFYPTQSNVDVCPSAFARRRMSRYIGLLRSTTAAMSLPQDEMPRGSDSVKATYRSGFSLQKSSRAKNKLTTVPTPEATLNTSTQQLAALVDQGLGQNSFQIGQITYSDEAIYEAAEDRFPMCRDWSVFLSGIYNQIQDPSTWSFHIPYSPRGVEFDLGEALSGEEMSKDEEVCRCDLNYLPNFQRAKRRSSLTVCKLAADPPWSQGRIVEKDRVTSANLPGNADSADLVEPSFGCEYPSLGSPLQLQSSIAPLLRDSVKLELKVAHWSV